MRSSIFAILLIGSFIPLTAQIESGTIDYLETFTFPMNDNIPLDMRKRIQAARERGDFDRIGRLSFNAEIFSYQQLPPEGPPPGGRGSGWMMRRSENPDVYYTNMRDSLVTDQRSIMDRSFLMEDRWVVPRWEIPANQRPNMAYTLPSEVAYAYTEDGDTLTAYFTRSIPLGIGPRGYGGLPGAIVYLKVDNNGMSREYTMQTMQPNAPDLNLIKPEQGDAISREEFEKIREKRREAQARRRRGWQRSRG